jgi:hypothetical protein
LQVNSIALFAHVLLSENVPPENAMAIAARHPLSSTPAASLTPELALRWAWWTWLALLIVPFLAFLWAIWTTAGALPGLANDRLAAIWCVGVMIYLALAVPISFACRNRFFKAYWLGQAVPPGRYLAGTVAVWLALASSGLLATIGCLVTGTLSPNLAPAAMALVVYLTLWPKGHAMEKPAPDQEDPEMYEEPR